MSSRPPAVPFSLNLPKRKTIEAVLVKLADGREVLRSAEELRAVPGAAATEVKNG